MLVKPPLEKLLPKVDNRYTLAILIAKRVRQLVDGAMPLLDSDTPNLVTLACEELASNRISCAKGQVNPYVPLRPEIEAARLAARTAASHASMADAVKEALDQAVGIAAEDLDETDIALISEALLNLDDEVEPDEAELETDTPQADELEEET